MKNKLSITSRIFLYLCALGLVLVIFVPIWRIELSAPQYPEGLSLSIYANGLRGNVAIINGLNHYIGMKTLHNEDFFEFTILPYCIAGFAIAFALVAIANRRHWLNVLLVLFIVFGIVAMADFWKWEYNYGHNLNPDAAIIVPGMAYQPPLIGFKQLLNFGAYSIPDAGGWIFLGAGLVLMALVVFEWKIIKRKRPLGQFYKTAAAAMIFFTSCSCNTDLQPIITGKDNCSFCKMTVSDSRFGAELITKKGKLYKFDDVHCIISWIRANNAISSQAAGYYLTDFGNKHQLMKAGEAVLLKSDALKTPMGGNIAAFASPSDLSAAMKEFGGTSTHWDDILKP